MATKKKQEIIQGLVDTVESKSQINPNIIMQLSSEELTMDYLMRNGFTRPVIVEDPKGLGMVVPDETTTVLDILRYIGADRDVRVINVWTQQERAMTFGKFTDYFLSNNRTECYNLLSLEISDTLLNDHVQAPLLVRELDWSATLLPKLTSGSWNFNMVQKYCLIGTKGSYTDFHIDFGGTSVWNHVLKGEKIFYLVEPTFENLSVFKYWDQVGMENRTSLAENVRNCYKVIIKAGSTLFLPSGWIHAVYTPVDTIVFAGNFLHFFNMEKQLQVFEMERLQKTKENFSYPGFMELNWFAAAQFPLFVKNLRSSSIKLPRHIVEGADYLLRTLNKWNKNTKRITRVSGIPDNIDVNEVILNLTQALTELMDAEIPENKDCNQVQASTEEYGIQPDDTVPELEIVSNIETDANPPSQDSAMSASPVLQKPQQKCGYCIYKNSDQWKLNRHVMRNHSNEKPYTCQWCSFSSTEKWHLERHHWRQHHGLRRRHRMKLREQ